jgi:type III secretion system YopN/LcrE/InvE/MxiC family regulator
MSVLPYGRVSELGTPSYVSLQPTQGSRPVAEVAKPAAPEATQAAEQAFSAAARPAHTRAEHESNLFLRQTDARQLVRHMYRMGRLRGQHAAFDQVFWESQLATQADALLRAARRVDGVRSLAERQVADPFRRYVALLEARERLGPDEAPQTPAQIDDALDEVWEGHEAEILAGFNTAPALMRFAEQIEEWDQFRNLYATLVINGEALASVFKALLERFGARRLARAVKALRDAIAADLASPRVSADRTRLLQHQIDLEGTHTISSMVAESDSLCRRLQPGDVAPEQVMEFVGGVFDFVAFSAYADSKLNVLCALLLPSGEVTEKVRGQVRDFLKQRVPLGLWRNPEVREQLFPSVYRLR